MKKIKDRVMLGAACALIASVTPKVMNAIGYKVGLTDIRFNQPAASLFLPKREAKANTIQGKIIASLVNNTMVSVTGTLITYMLSITGRDKAMIKGAGIGAIQWIGIYGLISRLGLIVKSNKPWTNILSFFEHTVFGASTALLVSKLGDDRLFPDKLVNSDAKLPIVTGTDQQSEPTPLKVRRIKNRHAKVGNINFH